MKKIGILTFHRALNYGAVLQSYGLFETITKLIDDDKFSLEIIDYRNDLIEKNRSFMEKIKKFSIKNLLKSFLLIDKIRRFNKFNKYLKISNLKFSKKNFSLNNKYDAIIVGSDQVWNYNLTNNDTNYLLDFSCPYKYSYAASFGLDEISKDFLGKYKETLSKFKFISVRENNGKRIIEDDFSLKCDGVHIDPVLLLDKNEWSKITNSEKEEKYILVYNVLKPKKIIYLAEILSELTGYPIKIIPNGINPKVKNGRKYFPDVIKFVELFKSSSFVLTNSFHGTVFSIIFNKKMLVELNDKGNDRILTLLNMCGLNNRILKDDNIETIFDEIDWSHVNRILDIEREKSIIYLKKIIGDIEEYEK